MISVRVSGGICFYKCLFGIKLLSKEASLDHATLKENLANNLTRYKTESSTLRSSLEEDQMVFAKHQLSKLPYGKP